MDKNKRHKHADLIHAWADGAEIQYEAASGDWFSSSCPNWDEPTQYRIKPKTKTVRFRNYLDIHNKLKVSLDEAPYPVVNKWLGDWQEIEVTE